MTIEMIWSPMMMSFIKAHKKARAIDIWDTIKDNRLINEIIMVGLLRWSFFFPFLQVIHNSRKTNNCCVIAAAA